MKHAIAVVIVVLFSVTHSAAQSSVERNVVYGMYSGLALLMDIHRPVTSNGRGVVYVAGSAFSRPLGFDAPQIKDTPIAQDFAKALTRAGYTVFAVNHRATPRFKYPAAVEDVQRAVRFVRAHAQTYGIDPNKIGAAGDSSGGYLVSMLGTLDGEGDATDADPVNRGRAKVQAVVALFAPFDLVVQAKQSDFDGLPEALFVGARIAGNMTPTAPEYRRYVAASPLTHVTRDASPFLLLHGDQDTTVPVEQSVAMNAALRKAGVDVTFVTVPGGRHGRNFGFSDGDSSQPDYLSDVVLWFNERLR